MKIIITSWKDIKNPQAGGAEILTHQIAKRVVKKGHKVIILSGLFPEGKKEEIYEGVKIIRPTYFYPTTSAGFLRLPVFLIRVAQTLKQIESVSDIIIDQVHGLPSFPALYSRKPVIFFPLEVANDIWLKEIPFPANLLGLTFEKAYLKLFKNRPFITISPSTANDLKNHGVTNISIITPGVSAPPQNLSSKTRHPSFVCLGRLTPMKRLEDTIEAFSIFHKDCPQSKFEIIGQGDKSYEKKIKKLATSLNLKKRINFHGFIIEKKKYELLSQSWALLSTSLREGWGLNVIEAASVGTPTIAYKVPGIIDTVLENKTGLLSRTKTTQSLVALIRKFIREKTLRKKLSINAKQHAKQFTWEKTTNQFLAAINKTLNAKR